MSTAVIDQAEFQDRAIGSMLGLAIGDAVGLTLERRERDLDGHVWSLAGGGWLRRAPGTWTDDTSMALALADSLLEHDGLNEADFLDRLKDWIFTGRYSCVGRADDVGCLTRKAVTNWAFFRQPRPGRTDRLSAGNGSIVRMAPVAIRFALQVSALRDAAVRQSQCTHGCREAVDACIAFGEIIADALNGAGRAVLEPRNFAGAQAVSRIMAGSWRDKFRRDIQSTGYVVHSLEAAMWSVGNSDSFEEAVLYAANLAGDADTIAAMAGQLAGAIYGAASIPASLSGQIAWRDHIVAVACQLAAKATISLDGDNATPMNSVRPVAADPDE